MAENKIRVIVEPDTRGFQSELNAELSKVKTDFDIPVDIDATAARVQIQRFKGEVASKPVDLNVDADTVRARTALANFTKTANTPIHKTVTLNTVGAQKALTGLGRTATGVFSSIGRNAARGAAGITALLSVAAFSGKDELIEAEKVSAQTAGIIAAQGKAATVTQKQVEALSSALLEKTGVDDQLIQSTANQILGNSNLARSLATNENFLKQATVAALGMSAVTGKELPASTKALTRALNEPTKAIKTLQRAGITLTKSQQQEIQALADSGHAHEARARIIQAVTKKTSAALDKQGETNAARLGRVQEQFAGFAAGLLEKMLPAFEFIANAIQKAFAEDGPATKFINGMMTALKPLVPAIKLLADILFDEFVKKGPKAGSIFKAIEKGMRALAKHIKDNEKEIRMFVGALGDFFREAGPAFVSVLKLVFNVTKDLAPIFLAINFAVVKVFTVIAKGINILATFLNENDRLRKVLTMMAAPFLMLIGLAIKFLPKLQEIGKAIVDFISEAPALWQAGWDIIVNKLNAVKAAIGNFIKNQVTAWQAGWARIVNATKSLTNKIFNYIKALPGKIMASIKSLIVKMVTFWKNVWTSAFNAIRERVTAIMAFVRGIPGRVIAAIQSLLTRVMNIFKAAFENARRAIVERAMAIIAFVRGIPARIIAALGRLAKMLMAKGREVFNGFLDGLKDGWEKVKDWLGNIKDWIVDLKGPPEVDSTILYDNGRRVMQGFHDGLKDKWDDVKGLLKEKTSSISSWLNPWDTIGDIQKLVAGLFNGEVTIDQINARLEEEAFGGLHPVTGPEDLKKQAAYMEKTFKLVVSSMYRAGAITSSGNVSQHALWQAVDFVGGGLQHWIDVAKKLSHLVGKVFKQIITNNQLYPGGGYVGAHMDHIHFGWIPGKRYGGRVMANRPYMVNEAGDEMFIPDTNGFVANNRMMNRLLNHKSMIENDHSHATPMGGGVHQSNTFNVEVKHMVPDASSLMAVLNTRLDNFVRANLPSLAGGIA